MGFMNFTFYNDIVRQFESLNYDCDNPHTSRLTVYDALKASMMVWGYTSNKSYKHLVSTQINTLKSFYDSFVSIYRNALMFKEGTLTDANTYGLMGEINYFRNKLFKRISNSLMQHTNFLGVLDDIYMASFHWWNRIGNPWESVKLDRGYSTNEFIRYGCILGYSITDTIEECNDCTSAEQLFDISSKYCDLIDLYYGVISENNSANIAAIDSTYYSLLTLLRNITGKQFNSQWKLEFTNYIISARNLLESCIITQRESA